MSARPSLVGPVISLLILAGLRADPIPLRVAHQVKCVAFSPDGKLLAAGGSRSEPPRGIVTIWDLDRGAVVRTCETESPVLSVAYAPDGKSVAVGCLNHGPIRVGEKGNSHVHLFDTASGKKLRTLDGHYTIGGHGVESLSFSPDGRYLASGAFDCVVRVWETASGKVVTSLKCPSRSITSLAFSPDGKRLAVGSGSTALKIHDPTNGKELASLDHDHSCTRVSYSPDGALLAVASPGINPISFWDPASNRLKFKVQIAGATGNLTSNLAFSPDGALMASGHGGFETPGEVAVWELKSRKMLTGLRGHKGWIRCVQFSPDGKKLVSVGEFSTLIWDFEEILKQPGKP